MNLLNMSVMVLSLFVYPFLTTPGSAAVALMICLMNTGVFKNYVNLKKEMYLFIFMDRLLTVNLRF